MPAPLIKRINLDLLHPYFVEPLLELLARCQAKGAHYYATLGFRTFAEQDALFAQGRTAHGKIVTNAPGGMSFHNYGLAVDVVRDANLAAVGLQPDWGREGYELLYKEANVMRLVTGFNWRFPDAGHIQYPKPKGFTDYKWMKRLKEIHDKEGLKAAFKAVTVP